MNLPIIENNTPIQDNTPAAPPLPMHPKDAIARGWDSVDIVFVTGDAYVDHPSFANGLLARLLESEGFRVAVLSLNRIGERVTIGSNSDDRDFSSLSRLAIWTL